MIQQIEDNDNGFTGFWSSVENLECGTIFLNKALQNDVFFDKLTNVTCLSEKMINEAVAKFQQSNSRPHVYSLNYPEFTNLLEKMGFNYYDAQYVLQKKGGQPQNYEITKITSDKINLWTRIFCEAYDCMNWEGTVSSILQNSLSSVEYYVDKSHSSCMALYEKNSILGLYCLGTMPSRRRQGLAALLIDFALSEVKRRGLEFLMLETYERDNLLNFYSKLGFERVYHKMVYTI